jgi:hypothetical protein
MPHHRLPSLRTRRLSHSARMAVLALAPALPGNVALAQTAAPRAAPPPFNIKLEAHKTWRHDTNALRQVSNRVSISGFDSAVGVTVNDSTPRSNVSLNSVVERNDFDDDRFNATNYHQKLKLGTRNAQWAMGLSGSLDYDTTRTSEITNFGVTIPRVRHFGWSVSPDISLTSARGSKWGLAGNYNRSIYDNASFNDYRFFQFRPYYNRRFDDLNTGIFSISAERFEAQNGTRNKLDSIGPSVGWTHVINAETTAGFTVGTEYFRQESPVTNTSQSRLSYVFSGNLTVSEQQDRLILSTSRSQQPFGNGASSIFTSFKATETHKINEQLALNGQASYRYADYLSAQGTNLDAELAGGAGISYSIWRDVDISANYQYNNQTLTSNSGTIRQHIFTIGLSIHPLEAGL